MTTTSTPVALATRLLSGLGVTSSDLRSACEQALAAAAGLALLTNSGPVHHGIFTLFGYCPL